METRTAMMYEKPDLTVELEHNPDDHQMEITAYRDVNGEREYMVANGVWQRSLGPDAKMVLTSVPCQVWNALVDSIQAAVYEDMGEYLSQLAIGLAGAK